MTNFRIISLHIRDFQLLDLWIDAGDQCENGIFRSKGYVEIVMN